MKLFDNLRIMWACAKKDLLTSLTERIFLITLFVIPLQYLFLFIIFVLPSDHAPTAVVMLDQGYHAQQLYSAMQHANSFKLEQTSASEADKMLTAGKIVAVVTIPQQFDAKVDANEPINIPVQINNLNTDFTEDIRRAVPTSITNFYAQAEPTTVTIVPIEKDWYAKDTDYISYIGVSILVLAIAIGGAIQSGTSWAREWELGTMKELLLSPASRWSIVAGKLIGAFIVALASAFVVLLALIIPLHSPPIHIGEMFLYVLLTLLIFCALGTLIGTVVKQRRLITTIVLGSSLFTFFVSGPLGPPSFSTPAIEYISRISPLAYAITGEQHAFHNFSTNTAGGYNVIILVFFAVAFICSVMYVLHKRVVS